MGLKCIRCQKEAEYVAFGASFCHVCFEQIQKETLEKMKKKQGKWVAAA